jgi:hypothetical protein
MTTFTPGLIDEARVIFFKKLPLDEAGLDFLTISIND